MRKNGKFIESYNKVTGKSRKFQGGGLDPTQAGGLLNLGASAIDAIDPGDEWGHRSMVGGIGSGMAKGAAAGAALGPIGMIGGAAIGGITGAIGTSKQNEAAELAKFSHQSDARMEARNYENLSSDMANFKKGGAMTIAYPQIMAHSNGMVQTAKFHPAQKLLFGGNLLKSDFGTKAGGGWAKNFISKPGDFEFRRGYQQFANGGNVNRLSDNTVAFEGNNPNAVDDINIGGGTFVDHNEAMVDTPAGEIIASDSIFLNGGKKSIASQVKRLQKTKGKARSPKKRAFYDYRTDVKLAQQELEAGRVDPQAVLQIAQPGGEKMEHGGIGDKDPNFHPEIAKDINFRDGGLAITNDVLERVSEYCSGGRKSMRKMEEGGKVAGQLEMGAPIEAEEHNVSRKKGTKIAKDHLKEHKDYYTKLKAAGLEMGGRPEPEVESDSYEALEEYNEHLMEGGEPNMLSLPIYHDVSGYEKELETEPGHEPGAATFKKGGIHIKPSKRGSFTSWAKGRGMGVQEAARKVMANTSGYSPGIVKKANFAKNAAGWKHAEGGERSTVDPAEGNNANAIPGRYIPSEYDYLSGDPEAQTPLGTISRQEFEAFQQDPTQIPAMREQVADATWSDIQGKFQDPSVQGLNLSNMHFYNANKTRALEYGDKIMGEYIDPLAGLPEMSGQGVEGAAMGPGAIPEVSGISPISEPQGSRKVSGYDYNIPKNKKFQSGLQRMVYGSKNGGKMKYQTGGAPQMEIPSIQGPTMQDYSDVATNMFGANYGLTRQVPPALGPTGGIQAPVLPETLNKIPVQTPDQKQPSNFMHDFAKGAAVFGPDVINAATLLGTPQTPSPTLNKPVRLQMPTNRAQMAQIAEAGRAGQKAVLSQGSQLGATMAGVNANMATKLQAINQANESMRNLRTRIGSQQAMMNQRTGMMNTGLQNQFKQDQLGRQLAIRKGLAGTAANIGMKGQALFAEKDKKAMDMLALKAMEKGFPTGIWGRNLEGILQQSNKERRLNR